MNQTLWGGAILCTLGMFGVSELFGATAITKDNLACLVGLLMLALGRIEAKLEGRK